jgi:hypothetical protein
MPGSSMEELMVAQPHFHEEGSSASPAEERRRRQRQSPRQRGSAAHSALHAQPKQTRAQPDDRHKGHSLCHAHGNRRLRCWRRGGDGACSSRERGKGGEGKALDRAAQASQRQATAPILGRRLHGQRMWSPTRQQPAPSHPCTYCPPTAPPGPHSGWVSVRGRAQCLERGLG